MHDLGRLHARILRTIVDTGRAPTIDELGREMGGAPDEGRAALERLSDVHGVVLHPKSREIWVAHPFSLAPTLFAVRAGDEVWWGPCGWCSLGVAALLGRDCRISTTLGGYDERVEVEIVDGQVSHPDLLVHFPVPMAKAWDNVTYTCSTMLFFEDTASIEAWSARHGIPRGDVQPLSVAWPFARRWYGRHLDEDWRKLTAAEAKQIFDEFGLDGPIWALPESAERF